MASPFYVENCSFLEDSIKSIDTQFNLFKFSYMKLQNNFWEFDFFRKNVFEQYERTRRVGHKNRSPRSLTLSLDFLRILKCQKMDQKSLNLYLCFWARDLRYSSETCFRW